MKLAEKIGAKEGADPDVVIPAALFHDVIIIPKNSPWADEAPGASANAAKKILSKLPGFPPEKTGRVCDCIRGCSFTKGEKPASLEAAALHDADLLEASGAVSIMRTFSSTGSMKRPFYCEEDPFCERREPLPKSCALDLVFARLLKAGGSLPRRRKRCWRAATSFSLFSLKN
ncbi:MAG: HD domain-containing protein [Candidatus Micrarchaeota archaeon]